MTVPPELRTLITSYQDELQEAVRFRPLSWHRALGPEPLALTVLSEDKHTWQDESIARDRRTDRQRVYELAAAVDLEDDESLLRAFLLVQAWGSGTSNSRTLKHTKSAFDDRENLLRSLRSTAKILRESDDTASLAEAYRCWKCAGVGRSFFTKWFTFAGVREGRAWQPLILDKRVLRTLNNTLNLNTKQLADSRNWRHRFQSYVETVHQWAVDTGTEAQRLEWILFCHNGKAALQQVRREALRVVGSSRTTASNAPLLAEQ